MAASLRKGDTVIVSGSLQFQSWDDDDGFKHTGTQILAHQVGPSLRFNKVTVNRTDPKADGPAVSETGPIIAPTQTAAADLNR